MPIKNARFFTYNETLRITSGNSGSEPSIEITLLGQRMTVDYAAIPDFRSLVDAYRSATPKSSFALKLSAREILITSGELSPETAGSVIDNRFVVIATEANLTPLL
ncbi:MAG: hypothetical protein WAU28_05355 [Candidatus Moraniibacteriota bacterium]